MNERYPKPDRKALDREREGEAAVSEPQTAAGRAHQRWCGALVYGCDCGVEQKRLAEARAAALDEAARAVDDIFAAEGYVRQSKILAAIDALREGER